MSGIREASIKVPSYLGVGDLMNTPPEFVMPLEAASDISHKLYQTKTSPHGALLGQKNFPMLHPLIHYHGSSRPCGMCERSIKGRNLDAFGKVFHLECFRCQVSWPVVRIMLRLSSETRYAIPLSKNMYLALMK